MNTWELPNGTWTDDGSGYWQSPETTKPWGAIVTVVVSCVVAVWFAYWSKHTGASQGNVSGSQLPSCIVEFAKNHFQQPASFGVACY